MARFDSFSHLFSVLLLLLVPVLVIATADDSTLGGAEQNGLLDTLDFELGYPTQSDELYPFFSQVIGTLEQKRNKLIDRFFFPNTIVTLNRRRRDRMLDQDLYPCSVSIYKKSTGFLSKFGPSTYLSSSTTAEVDKNGAVLSIDRHIYDRFGRIHNHCTGINPLHDKFYRAMPTKIRVNFDDDHPTNNYQATFREYMGLLSNDMMDSYHGLFDICPLSSTLLPRKLRGSRVLRVVTPGRCMIYTEK